MENINRSFSDYHIFQLSHFNGHFSGGLGSDSLMVMALSEVK